MITRSLNRLVFLAALLAVQRPTFAAELHNPDPTHPCHCVKITVNGKENPADHADAAPTTINEVKGNYTFNVAVSVPPGVTCANVTLSSIKVVPADSSGEACVIDAPGFTAGTQAYSGSVTVPGGKVETTGTRKWKVVVDAYGLRQDEALTSEELLRDCTYPVTLGGCSSCQMCEAGGSGTGPPQVSNDSGALRVVFPMDSAAGDANGTVEFHAPDITNPGPAGLTASVPSTFIVLPAVGVITKVVSPIAALEVSAATGYDSNAFTLTHKHVVGGEIGAEFRTTTIALVDGHLRVDSTHQGTTIRFQQSKSHTNASGESPAYDSYILESGPLSNGSFTALRRETLRITIPELGTEIHRKTLEERAAGTESFGTVSVVETTWSNFAWGWERTRQAIDPDNANLVSTWSYYGPGETSGPGASTEGFGRVHIHTSYDGPEEIHTYWLYNHQTQIPFAGGTDTLTITRTWNPSAIPNTLTTIRSVGHGTTYNVLSKETEAYSQTGNILTSITTTTYTSAAGTLTTTTDLKTFGLDFGGKPASVTHPDGTLTTYEYSRHTGNNYGGGKTVTMKTGYPTEGTVSLGRSTSTTYNRNGTPILRKTDTIGYPGNNATLDHFAVTEVDSFGRATTTAYFPTASAVVDDADYATATGQAWTTTADYSCCGIASATDRDGVETTYAHDGLGRQVKATSLGVTTETARHGRTTQTHRYAATTNAASPTLEGAISNTISLVTRNVAGTETATCSPNPASDANGALVAATTRTIYADGYARTTSTAGGSVDFDTGGVATITPGAAVQVTTSFPDGRTYQSAGDLAPGMQYDYAVNSNGLLTNQYYLAGAAISENGEIQGGELMEASSTQSDLAGRTIHTAKGSITQTYTYFGTGTAVPIGSRGNLFSVKDADHVLTLYGYNSIGERTTTAVNLGDVDEENPAIDFDGTDQITVTETAPGSYADSQVLATTTMVYATNASGAPTLSTIARQTPDGLTSWSSTPESAASTIGLNFCNSDYAINNGTADGFDGWIDGIGPNSEEPLPLGDSGVSVTWASSGIGASGSDATTDATLYTSFLADGETSAGIGVRVTISGLGTWLSNGGHGSYQVRCYSNNREAITYQPVTIRNGATATSPAIQTITPTARGDGGYPPGSPPTSGESRAYVDSTPNLTADTITITIPARVGTNCGTLCAFKITGFGTTTKTVSTVGLNRTQTATRPDLSRTVTTYSGGRPLTVIRYTSDNATISTLTQGFDSLGRPVSVTDSRTGTTTTTFVSSTCDAVKSVTEENGNDDRTTIFTYDSRGNRLATTHPDDSITHNRYNSKNQLEATWGSLAYATVYSYDYAGRMLTLRTSPSVAPSGEPADSEGTVTRWQYDATTGLLTGKFYDYREAAPPITANLTDGPTYSHTAGGRLQTRTWKRNITTNYYYNLGGQLRAVDYSDTTPDVLYTRDRLGRMATVAQGSLTVVNGTLPVDDDGITISALRGAGYTYDPGDFHLATEVLDYGDGFTKSLTRYVDAKGRIRSLKVGADYAAAYGYDNAGRLNQVWDHPTLNGGEPAGNASFSYGYVNNSNALVETLAGSVHTVTNTWEPTRDVLATKINEVTVGTHYFPSSFAYGVNAIGQRETVGPVLVGGTPISTYTPKWAWDYNNSGELVSADHGADAMANTHDRFYKYDRIGNRDYVRSEVFTDGGGTLIDYTANALNQYTVANDVPLPTVTATGTPHDEDGNLRFDGGVNKDLQAREYFWDGENRLIEVRDVSGENPVTLVSYQYDHLSRLIARTDATATVTTRYLYDGWNLIAEYIDTTLTKSYLWGMDLSGSMQGAGGVGGLLAETDEAAAGDPHFYPTFDGNGNVTEYLNGNGVVAAHFEYDAFGNTVVNTDTTGRFHFRFSTKYLDLETGLYYYGYRWYDLLTGRWPSRDPIGERGGVNLYGFVGNNGVSWIDLLGCKLTVVGLDLPLNADDRAKALVAKENKRFIAEVADQLKKICPDTSVDESGQVTVRQVTVGQDKSQTNARGCCCIRELVDNSYDNRIYSESLTGMPRTSPNDLKRAYQQSLPKGLQGPPAPGLGSSGKVYINTNLKFEEKRAGKWEPLPSYVVLAHELCGHLLPFNKGIHVKADPFGPLSGTPVDEVMSLEAENAIRSENGIPLRVNYDDEVRVVDSL